ncbi:C-C motif chemokine 4-like isoform X2 [Macrotis lagotis]|uniref:C-C motif chemokine 4-like isoform X2 n=1 Tax=Macrotis lagotis TaxID=92651 RepID=UPI003D683AAB
MKVSLVALSILMVMAFGSLVLSAPMGSDPPTYCCFSYVSQQISRKIVIDYYETSSLCSQPAVVGQQVCAQPSEI